ncbi:hypothetical protein TNIN_215061, partial [Trichonephila inaurata madagascariensis]
MGRRGAEGVNLTNLPPEDL